MLMHVIRQASVLLCIAGGLAAPSQTMACGFDGLIENRLTALHPRSIQVALAIRDAVDDGFVPASALAPIQPGSAGYWRAATRLKALDRRLSVAQAQAPDHPSISVLFIDSNLWTRFFIDGEDLAAAIHAAGSTAGDVELITSEAILAEMLDRRITFADALDHGLIEVRGPDAAAAKAWLALALDLADEEQRTAGSDGGAFPLFGTKPGR